MTLSSPFCRVGRKKPIQFVIERLAPKNYDTYVEPFVGSGDIYFKLNLSPTIKAVINDKDDMISNGFKILKSNPSIDNIDRFKSKSIEEITNFVKASHSSPIDKLAKIIYLLCGTFGSTGKGKIYKSPNIETKLRKIPDYAEYMKNTKVLNQDYKSVILNNNTSNAFFFIDPPYEKSKDLYKDSIIDYEELAIVLSKVKGKFILTLNDSPDIRRIFNKFKIRGITLEAEGNKGVGSSSRKEVIIKNY